MNSTPVLSVIVADEYSSDNLELILRKLNPAAHPDLEIILCSSNLEIGSSKFIQFPNVRFLTASPQTRIPYLCKDGIRASRAGKVALLTGHMIPEDDWVDCALQLDVDKEVVGWGGAILTSGRKNALEIAIYLLRYARFSSKRASGIVQEIAADNAVYLKSEILRYESLLDQGFWEPTFHERFHGAGKQLGFEPALAVMYRNQYRPMEFIRQRYEHGNSNGRTRGSAMSVPEKIARILAFPVVSTVVVAKSLFAADKSNLERGWVLSLVWLQIFSIFWCLGEARGYLQSIFGIPEPEKPMN